MKPRRYQQLTDALSRMEVADIVEIGTWNAARARELATVALRRSEAVTYQGFDLFEQLTEDELAAELSKQPPSLAEVESALGAFAAGVARRGRLRRGRRRRFEFSLHMGHTRETLPAFRASRPSFAAQFVFIDGGHRIETIDNDWAYCSQLLDPSGALFLDDYYGDPVLARSYGCNELVGRLRDDPHWDVTVLPVADRFAIGSIRIARVTRARA